MKRTAIMVVLGFAWLLVTFVAGLMFHFPEQSLIERLRWEVQNNTDGEMALQAEGARLWRLSGVSLNDVTLLKVPTNTRRRGNDDDETASALFRADHVSARAELLSLLRGDVAAQFQTEVFNGNLSGRVAQGAEATTIQANAEDINLSLIPIAGEEWNVDASGRMNVDVDLQIAERVKDSEGTLNITMSNLNIEGGQVMGFDFTEPTPFSKATLALEADNGKLQIQEGIFVSEPVEIELDGYLSLAKTLRRMRMNIDIKLKLSESLDNLVKALPTARNARDEDGVYHFTLTGTPQAPRFREDRAVSRRNRTSGPPGAARQRIEDRIRETEAGLSEDELEEARARRREEMRNRMSTSRPARERPTAALGRDDGPVPLNQADQRGEPFDPQEDEDFLPEDELSDEDEFGDEDDVEFIEDGEIIDFE